jgi:hypothetical protein
MSAAAASLLKDASLLKTKSYVNGEWVDAKSGKQFTVDSKFHNAKTKTAVSMSYIYLDEIFI